QTEDPSASIKTLIDRIRCTITSLQMDSRCRDCGVLSGNKPGGAGLQRASENQDNPAQKAGHTMTVQRSENQGEKNREHDTRTACNELTKTT
ncbi:hypothetical protein DPX16_17350, partial [Anabarilius grahami]